MEAVHTVGFVTFSLAHIFAALSYRDPGHSVFRRETFNNRNLNLALLIAFLATFLPTEVGFLNRIMGLVSLSFDQWLWCAAFASLTLWVSEGYKWIARRQ